MTQDDVGKKLSMPDALMCYGCRPGGPYAGEFFLCSTYAADPTIAQVLRAFVAQFSIDCAHRLDAMARLGNRELLAVRTSAP